MPNYTIDNNRVVHDSRGDKIGDAGYDGQVRDGWRDKGKIDGERYTDEYGHDQGWVTRSSSSSRSTGSSGGGSSLIVLMLVLGIFYLMYLGIQWLVVEGKKSMAHASRSWGITSLMFPFVFFMALKRGYQALDAINLNGDPNNQKRIATFGIVTGYIGAAFLAILFIAFLVNVVGT
jgi:hypothetical protein